MSHFKPLNIRKYKKAGTELTTDNIYWKRLSQPTLVKDFGAIDYINFSPVEPYYFAVTCSVRVSIYNPITKLVVKNLSRFQKPAYGGTFRQDGRLLIAGDEEGFIKMFDISSRNVLRSFKGHTAAVHRAHFTADMQHIASFSDDHTVKLWDISTEQIISSYDDHTDYIRAGAVNPISNDIVVSGGYDGKINVYDTRTNKISFTVDHGCSVEALLYVPSGSIFISAGGTEMRVWDTLAGCSLLTKVSQHHKNITCLQMGSNGRRILSGGLDRHVKIYDVTTYQTVHTMNFPTSVLALGVSHNDENVVAGTVDGLISIQTMESERKSEVNKQADREKSALRTNKVRTDHAIHREVRKKASKYDNLLRSYEYVKCLDAVMIPNVMNRSPEVAVAVMQELIHRKGLQRAITARSNRFLCRLILFIRRYIGEHRFMRVLIDVGNELLNVYEKNFNEFNDVLTQHFIKLAETIQNEIDLTYSLLEMQGSLEMIIASCNDSTFSDEKVQFVGKENITMKPSEQAEATSVVMV